MAQIFENVKPGDLITAELFNKMADKIEELFDRVAAIERTATGTIAGAVKDFITNAPIIGGMIYAVSGNVTYSSAPTENLGNYSITNLLPGIYRVWAEAENYARSKAETVTVTSAATSSVNFVLTSAVSMVIVPDVQGLPLSQALALISNSGLKTGFILDTHHNVIDPRDPAAASLLVINQSLSPGDPVPVGTTINLFMAVHAAVALPPIILDIKPNLGKVGDEVEIIGMGFGAQKGKVIFSGVEATDIKDEDWAGNSIKVKIPTGAAIGTVEVQVTNIDGVKSNTFSFTVKADGCTTGCQASCTASCTIGCTSGCTASCTTSCTIARREVGCVPKVEVGCLREVGCMREVGCLREGCMREVGCLREGCMREVGCLREAGCMREVGCLREAGCMREVGCLREAGCMREGVVRPSEDILVSKGLEGLVANPETTLPVTGEIKEGNVRVELGKAIIPSGTEVTLKTPEGAEIKGSSLSSAGIGVKPVETVVEVVGEDGKITKYGGTLISASGAFKKDEGIAIDKGSEATVIVAGKAVTGKVAENVRIGTEKLDMGRRGTGITRLTG